MTHLDGRTAVNNACENHGGTAAPSECVVCQPDDETETPICPACGGLPLPPTDGPDGTEWPRVCGVCAPPPPSSIPMPAAEAALAAFYHEDDGPWTIEDAQLMQAAIAAALTVLGCVWDDDQGKNSMRRIVGVWVDKP